MELVDRRSFLLILPCAGAALAQTKSPSQSIRGKLTAVGGKPALDVPGRGMVLLTGDKSTVNVLQDGRLAGSDFEALGHFEPGGAFRVDPIYVPAMFVHRGGKRLYVTYWCELCAIRTYTPGICYCCQQETALDLRENDDR